MRRFPSFLLWLSAGMGALGSFAGALAEPAVVSRSTQPLASGGKGGARVLALRCGSPEKPKVAITFDDGPTRRYTRKVLAILRQQRVKATFFVLGQQARSQPDLIRGIDAEGHLLANHSWGHPRRADLEEWRAEIQKTRDAIARAGVKPNRFFRPPHGTVTPAVQQACAEQDLTIILYTLLSSDWTRPGADALVKQVVRGMAPGGIVVLHDGGGERSQTVEALPQIIKGLRQRGLEPVRLDELLGSELRVETCARPVRGR
jgi:peptidoglycan-N-acetylglucosamine deacetylase